MSVRRVMGTEVEYGISVPGQPTANPTTLSSQVVNAWAVAEAPTPRRPRWDFEEESPLRDARGFDLSPAQALDHNDLDEDTGMANVILTNGARLYVDHAHPEYSTPEVTNPRDIVLWDKAGEQVMAEAARRAARIPGSQPIQLYKNNTDGKGASYGVARELPDGPEDAVHRHHPRPGAVLRDPAGVRRRRAGSASARRAAGTASSSPSGPTSSRSRSAWRRRSSGRSSTPATSRTPTPTSTAGCT